MRQEIIKQLLILTTKEGAEYWLDTSNSSFDGRVPNEMIENGQGQELLDAFDLLNHGKPF